jgi:C-terminal processing protease CtpA/Prc
MRFKRPISTLMLALGLVVLSACGGNGDAADAGATALEAPVSCSVADQRSWLRGYMADQYFWFDRMGKANAAAPDLTAYFKSLLYPVVDRYSYTEPTTQFVQFYKDGTYVGYGYSLAWSDTTNTSLKVRQVEPLSPVGLAGLRRGETVISIDGYGAAQIAAGTLPRVNDPGIARTFVVRNAAGEIRTFTVMSQEYPYVSVPASGVLTQEVGASKVKVGYLVYQQFVNGSAAELASAFKAFTDAGVKELVLDLRYNGGGSISVARNVASLVGGLGLAGKTFVQLRYSTRHPENNSTYLFSGSKDELPAPPLEGLSRVIIIAAEGTASASELVINGLKPHIPVVLIGATTYGKPYGFLPVDACDLTYNAVNFESVNALGEGGYNSGIAPTCEVPDDLDHQLGDPAEGRLAAALSYVKTGACPARTATLRSATNSSRLLDNAFGELPRQRMLAD